MSRRSISDEIKREKSILTKKHLLLKVLPGLRYLVN